METATSAPVRDEEVLLVYPVEIRSTELIALVGGQRLALTWREFRLLQEFARRPDLLLARATLYEAAWGSFLGQGDRSVDVYVSRLRVKLFEVAPAWSFIHTHFGFGYRFLPERSRHLHSFATAE